MPVKVTARSVIIVGIIGVIAAAYFLSRFSAAQRFTLFFINKGAAETAVVLIGLSFLLGPLCKILPPLRSHLYLRRYFGLAGFFIVLAHIVLSLAQYTARFPFKWYIDHQWGVIAAIVATGLFLILAVTSNSKAIRLLGGVSWKTVQRLGYIALALSAYHIYIAGHERWDMWFQGKVTMPSSFAVFVFALVVLVARLLALGVDTIRHNTAHKALDPADTIHHGISS